MTLIHSHKHQVIDYELSVLQFSLVCKTCLFRRTQNDVIWTL